MAKRSSRGHRRFAFQQLRSTPYPLPDYTEDICTEKCPKASDNKDWEDAMCSVCMEYPHNAVLLLCSSHEKGCRPYMCGTSCRYSNCLDQYKKAYTKGTLDDHASLENPNSETSELACPLCRGQVKGWTVVEPARHYMNAKKRSCMEDDCAFIGTYKELRKHVKAEHPSSRPREVDPVLEQKWRRLEREREHNDVLSTIRSTMPGSMVFGDYVIEGGSHIRFPGGDEEEDDVDERNSRGGNLGLGFNSNLVNVFLLLHAFGQRESADQDNGSQNPMDDDDDDTEDDDNGDGDGDCDGDGDGRRLSLVRRLRQQQGDVLLERSRRRRRRREVNRESR